jgi:hypothetical protein
MKLCILQLFNLKSFVMFKYLKAFNAFNKKLYLTWAYLGLMAKMTKWA